MCIHVRYFRLFDTFKAGSRGMPGPPMPTPLTLDPMVSQRPSIVAGTGRPTPHHPDHKTDLQSAIADSTSMQQQRGQLSPRQGEPGRSCWSNNRKSSAPNSLSF